MYSAPQPPPGVPGVPAFASGIRQPYDMSFKSID